MTSGSSQGLFVIVAIVIFGIFVVISYLLFRDKLQTGLASIFKDGVTETIPADTLFNNSTKDKEYREYKDVAKTVPYEFLNSNDWDLAVLGDYFKTSQIYTLTFEIKSTSSGNVTVYNQNGSNTRYQMIPSSIIIKSTTEYQKVAVTFKLNKTNDSIKKSLLAFFGGYDTGVAPIVKNVKVEKGNTTKELSSDYLVYDNFK